MTYDVPKLRLRRIERARKKMPTPNEGKNDLLCTQLVANNYFDTAELLGHRGPIILAKENNCLQQGELGPFFALVIRGRFFSKAFWPAHHRYNASGNALLFLR